MTGTDDSSGYLMSRVNNTVYYEKTTTLKEEFIMYTYNKLKSNYETIKELCKRYRTELTVYSGILGEELRGNIVYLDYVKFMNELSDDVFAANYLFDLTNDYNVELYRKVLDGEETFDYLVGLVSDDIKEKFYEKMKELEEAQS
jgi:hypothetical protein